MNFVLHGHAVSGGITVGYAHLVSTARLEVAHYEVAEDRVEAEVKRFDAAMKTAQDELYELKAHIPDDAPAGICDLSVPSSTPARRSATSKRSTSDSTSSGGTS